MGGFSIALLSKLAVRLAGSNESKIRQFAKHFGFANRMGISDAQHCRTNFAVIPCYELRFLGYCCGDRTPTHTPQILDDSAGARYSVIVQLNLPSRNSSVR